MKKLFLLLILAAAPAAGFAAAETAADAEVADAIEEIAEAPVADVPAAEHTGLPPRADYWTPGLYAGVEVHHGAAEMVEKNDTGYYRKFRDTGMSGNVFAGYKFPFIRIGGEMGLFQAAHEFKTDRGTRYAEDSFQSVSLMPQVFLDLDIPGWRANPYIGAGYGLSFVKGTYDDYTYGCDQYGCYISSSVRSSEDAAEISTTYMWAAGVRIALTTRLELNMGYRFQDYGKVVVGSVNTENRLTKSSLTLGVAFKI